MIREMSHGEADYFGGSDATERDHRVTGQVSGVAS
jgi:hypothetical protein